MEEKINWFGTLLDKAIEFAKTGIELLKLRAIDKIAEAISSVLARIAAAVILFTGLMIGSIGAALWLGELLGKSWYGFFIVAGFYFLLGLVMYFLLRKSIKTSINNFLIKKVMK